MTFFPKNWRPKISSECIDLVSDDEDDKISQNLKILQKYLQHDVKNISTDTIPPSLIDECNGTDLKHCSKDEDVEVIELPSSSTCATDVKTVIIDDDEVLENAINSVAPNGCDNMNIRTNIPITLGPIQSAQRRWYIPRHPIWLANGARKNAMPYYRRSAHPRWNTGRTNQMPTSTTTITKEETNESLQVSIINAKNPDRPLTGEEWAHIELFLMDCMHDSLMNTSIPRLLFGRTSMAKGFKILACQNEHTLRWLMDTVETFKVPWDDVVLKVVKKSDLQTRPIARMYIPGPTLSKSMLEDFLRKLNPEFPSHDWTVLDMEESDESGQEAIIMLNHQSMVMLPSRNFMVRVGLKIAKVRPILGRGESLFTTNSTANFHGNVGFSG